MKWEYCFMVLMAFTTHVPFLHIARHLRLSQLAFWSIKHMLYCSFCVITAIETVSRSSLIRKIMICNLMLPVYRKFQIEQAEETHNNLTKSNGTMNYIKLFPIISIYPISTLIKLFTLQYFSVERFSGNRNVSIFSQ